MQRFSRRGLLKLLPVVTILGAGVARAAPANDGTWSAHPLWPVLKETHLATGPGGDIRAAFAPQVLLLADKPMTISGFILPIETSTRYRHFILSRYSPECPFCPAGGPTEVIEIFSDGAVGPTPAMVMMKGVFSVQGDMAKGMFYRLEHATMV